MRPSDNKQILKPTKPLNTNEQKQLTEIEGSIDKNWNPTGNHPDKKNIKTH